MRREIIGIILFFLVIFSLVSLLSYSPNDPSIHNATSPDNIHNLFGRIGGHVSGVLIGLFGLGSLWVPILLLLASVHFFEPQEKRAVYLIASGGLLLIVTSGSLLCFINDSFVLFGNKFSSGGIIGISLKSFLVKYTNPTGGLFILLLFWTIGLITATGFSIVSSSQVFWRLIRKITAKVKGFFIFWKEGRKRSKKRIIRDKKFDKNRKIAIKSPKPNPIKKVPPPKQEVFPFMRGENEFQLPSLRFLEEPSKRPASVDGENLKMQSKLLEKKLEDFGVAGTVTAVIPGPVITTFEYKPAPGVKINKIVNLTDDLALALRAISIRIVAPIPGKAAIGIEIPNTTRELVRFKEVVSADVFEESKSSLTICLGKDIEGNPVMAKLEAMPHLLIAGATGTGKSVGLNAMICSLLYKSSPDDVKLIMIDPKRIELSIYDGIPHLITPVVTDVKKATNALFWAVKEMERRYELLSEKKARNIVQYNRKVDKEPKKNDDKSAERLPYIVIIIDELADLMMIASRDVETALTRLAQMARAAGIHLILATQRPSVDVLTGIIKANFPTRLTFQVSSKTDSRTIIDMNGAENLLGNGDMLFLPPGTARLQRIHGAYISESELTQIVDFLKQQKKPDYDETVVETALNDAPSSDEIEYDEKYDEAVALITKVGHASISLIQRHLRIGYNRAARIVEVMETEGVVGPSDGVKPREVLVRGYDKKP